MPQPFDPGLKGFAGLAVRTPGESRLVELVEHGEKVFWRQVIVVSRQGWIMVSTMSHARSVQGRWRNAREERSMKGARRRRTIERKDARSKAAKKESREGPN